MVHHRDFDKDVAHRGRTNQDIVAICHEQDALEIKFITRIGGQAVHFDGPPFDGAVLLAAAFNNCKSHFVLQSFTSPCACGSSFVRHRLRTGKLVSYKQLPQNPTTGVEAHGIIHVRMRCVN